MPAHRITFLFWSCYLDASILFYLNSPDNNPFTFSISTSIESLSKQRGQETLIVVVAKSPLTWIETLVIFKRNKTCIDI
jgi:hypothetical protein